MCDTDPAREAFKKWWGRYGGFRSDEASHGVAFLAGWRARKRDEAVAALERIVVGVESDQISDPESLREAARKALRRLDGGGGV